MYEYDAFLGGSYCTAINIYQEAIGIGGHGFGELERIGMEVPRIDADVVAFYSDSQHTCLFVIRRFDGGTLAVGHAFQLFATAVHGRDFVCINAFGRVDGCAVIRQPGQFGVVNKLYIVNMQFAVSF